MIFTLPMPFCEFIIQKPSGTHFVNISIASGNYNLYNVYLHNQTQI